MSMSNEIRRAATSTTNHPERDIHFFINIDSRTNCLQNIGTPRKNIYKSKNFPSTKLDTFQLETSWYVFQLSDASAIRDKK